MSKIIIIKHASGEYKIPVDETEFENLKKVIIKCIQNRMDALVFQYGSGNEQHFPAELLRNSVITFETDHGVVSSSGIEAEWNE